MKPAALMTAEEISQEIYGGRITARVISERYSFLNGYPKAHQVRQKGRKFWNRQEIYNYYGVKEQAAS